MTSIGDTLRRERQRRNLDLPRISGELKISARFLDAMEHDDFAKLPGGVFTKSFIRQYAVFLGLDGEELVAEMERATAPEPEAHILERPKPDVPVIDLGSTHNWQSVTDRGISLPSWLKAGALLVGLMLACSVIYWWWQRPHHTVVAHEGGTAHAATPAPVPPPASPPAANLQPVAESTPAPQAAPAAATQTTADATAAGTAAPPANPEVANPAPNPNATVRVGIVADEAVWVRAEANGKYQFSGTLQAHETRNVDADGEVTLRLGNAGGVTLTLNGKPVGPVGPKGQIRTVQFTSGGFQIVSPPKPDPLDRL